MLHRSVQRIILTALAAFFVIASAWGQDTKGLIGKWNMTSETDGDPVKWTLVISSAADSKISAVLATDGGELPAKDFTYEGGVIKFKAPYNGEDYEIELKQDGEKLVGKWSGSGNSGATFGTKA